MDVYVKQIMNSANHDLFYTDSRVKVSSHIPNLLESGLNFDVVTDTYPLYNRPH